MAFVSLILGALVFFAIAAFFMVLFGVVLIIIGNVNRKKPKNQGKKWPKISIAIGIVTVALPVIAIGYIVIIAALDTDKVYFELKGYENVIDKWRYEEVSDNSAANDALEALLEAADNGDKDAFAKLFAPNIYNNTNFRSKLDTFFDFYPGGLSEFEFEIDAGSGNPFDDSDDDVKNGRASVTCCLGDEWYYMSLNFCFKNSDSPDDVGVTFFLIENLEANAQRNTALEGYFDRDYMICNIGDENEITARLIGGRGYVFTPFDRKLNINKVKSFLRQSNSIDLFIEHFGQANVIAKAYGGGTDYFFELEDINDEPRYLKLFVPERRSVIIYATLYDDKSMVFDDYIILKMED